MARATTVRLDDHELRAFLNLYDGPDIDKVLQKAALAGAKAAERIVRPAVPIGTSRRPSQYYRRQGLGHGTFARTVKARRIRKRGDQRTTIGYVIGPAGKNAFTRAWIAGGTRPHLIRRGRGGRIQHPGEKANRWFPGERAGAAAEHEGESYLVEYGKKTK